jgi:uncharacterized membrane protein HdeD (DUF308 family)
MNQGELALLIPIIAITLTMTVAVVFIVAWYRRSAQELDQRHKERMAAIDRGLDLPLDPVRPPGTPSRQRYLLRGLVWLFVGLAIVFGARTAIDVEAASLGWIPVAIGAAYLIFYFVEGRRESAADKAGQAPGTQPGSQT